MDMADRKGSAFRRLLCSAERFSDCAISRASSRAKTPCSRSSASLLRVTSADQYLRLAALVLAFGLVAMSRFRGSPEQSINAGRTGLVPSRPIGDQFDDDEVAPASVCSFATLALIRAMTPSKPVLAYSVVNSVRRIASSLNEDLRKTSTMRKPPA